MTRKFIICSSVILLFALTQTGFADEHFPLLAEVSKESVNVRAGPNTNFEKIDKLSKGTQVVVLGRSYEWFKIQPLSTTKEYIRADYLKVNEGGAIALVIGNNVNVRSNASSDAASLGEVKKGTLVKVLDVTKGWCSLAPVVGTAAWIHQDFVKELSTDVPASMLIVPIQMPAVASAAAVTNIPEKIVVQTVSLQGVLQVLPISPADDVHYKIAIDDNTVYYIKDVPHLSFFANTVVTVEGTIVPDPLKKFMYPLLQINKIALVL